MRHIKFITASMLIAAGLSSCNLFGQKGTMNAIIGTNS